MITSKIKKVSFSVIPVKRILFAIAGLMGLLILIAVALFLFVDTDACKSRLGKAASEALGMDIRVGGRMGVAFFPGLQVRLADVRIRSREADVAAAKEARLEIDLLPLLHREIRVRKIGLQSPRISIKRDRDGAFNFGKRKEATGSFLTLALDNLSLTDAVFLYGDEQSGEEFEVRNFSLDVRSSRTAVWKGPELFKNLSFTAAFACREIRTKDLLFSDVKFTCQGKDGVFTFHPVTMRLFGGQGAGSLGADFSGSVPRYAIRSSLSKFRIEEYFKTLSSKKVAEGPMDISLSLSMRGNTAKEIRRSAGGDVSLRGENLTLHGRDLDRDFARYESSQKFNLLDVGAFFFAGPLGLAVTKGYNFASSLQGSGGSSSIGKLLSDWKIEGGIAHAKDVALATRKNRIALKGSINLVNERFDDVTIALIDARGCARVKQKIYGTFRKPVVEKPSVLLSLAGPTINLFKRARDLFTDGKCDVFYEGSLPAPK